MNTRTSKLWRIAGVVALALLGALAVAAGAGTLAAAAPAGGVINVDGSNPSCVPDTSPPDPYVVVYCEIEDAINESAAGDVVVVAAGTYTETIDVNGKTVTVNGAGEGSTFVDGASIDCVFEIWGSSVVTLTGMTIQNGYASGGKAGGGIYSYQSTVTLIDVTLFDNHATSSGGGGAANWDGMMTLRNTTVYSNATSGWGGGLRGVNDAVTVIVDSAIISNTAGDDGGGIQNPALMTVTNTTIASNTVTGVSSIGGGVASTSAGETTLRDVTIRNNRCTGAGSDGGGVGNWRVVRVSDSTIEGNRAAENGGGIYSYGGTVLVERTTIASNRATKQGGGIHAQDSGSTVGDLTIRDSTIYSNTAGTLGGGGVRAGGFFRMSGSTVASNTAQTDGGGVYVTSGATGTIESSTIHGNSASDEGGGIYDGTTATALAITNTTVSSNSAATDGGGIANDGLMTLVNCTIADNVADSDSNGSGAGGGYFSDGSGRVGTFVNTILADNVVDSPVPVDNDCQIVNSASNVSLGHNVVENTSSCIFLQPGDIGLTDPTLGPLADNGGNTWTHALLDGSVARDGGDDAACPATDQRGLPRISPCDVGAYEHVMQVFLPLVLRSW